MSKKPIEELSYPEPWDPIPDMVELVTNANGISPAYWLNGICKTLTGVDPIGTITNYVTGDWEAIQQAAIAIDKMAKYNSSFSAAIDDAVKEFGSSWHGNAADGAREYFSSLTDGLNSQIEPLEGMAREIEEFADTSYLMAQTISALVQKMFDDAFLFFTFKAAAAALTASVAGSPAAVAYESAAALQALSIIKHWTTIIGNFGTMYGAAEGVMGLLGAGMNAVQGLPHLPRGEAAGYDHPGAIST